MDGALDRMDQEQGPLLALNLVEGGHRGAVGVHQQLGQVRLQQSVNTFPLSCGAMRVWRLGSSKDRTLINNKELISP